MSITAIPVPGPTVGIYQSRDGRVAIRLKDDNIVLADALGESVGTYSSDDDVVVGDWVAAAPVDWQTVDPAPLSVPNKLPQCVVTSTVYRRPFWVVIRPGSVVPFFAYNVLNRHGYQLQDLTVVDDPRNDPEAVALIEAARPQPQENVDAETQRTR